MHQKNIYIPSHIQNILFVQKRKKYLGIDKQFDSIKKTIMNNTLMFRKVEISPILEKTRESTKNKGFYITKIQNFNMYKFLWFKEYW